MSFLLAIFGTFITRSGVIESVHSFAQSPVGTWFATFFFLATGITIYLVATRLQDLEAKAELESMVSREAAFLYNNLLLIGIAFAVLWGTLFPILSEWAREERRSRSVRRSSTRSTFRSGCCCWRSPASVRSSRGAGRRCPTSGGSLPSPRSSAWSSASCCSSRSACATSTRSSRTRSAASSPARSCRSSTRACARGSRFIGESVVRGVRASGRAQSSPLWRLHRARGHRDALRRVRRHGVQDRARCDLETGETYEVKDPYGHDWKFVSQGVSTSSASIADVVAVGLEACRDGKRYGIISSEKRNISTRSGNPLFEPITEVGIHYHGEARHLRRARRRARQATPPSCA